MIENLNKIPPELAGFLMAVIISVARVLGDDKENKPVRILLESLICGGLSLAVSYAILATGLSMAWSAFAGGVIGYLGSATVRALALKFINSKIEVKK